MSLGSILCSLPQNITSNVGLDSKSVKIVVSMADERGVTAFWIGRATVEVLVVCTNSKNTQRRIVREVNIAISNMSLSSCIGHCCE